MVVSVTSAVFVKGVVGADDVTHDGTPTVAFIGRSNVGKSSLVNALAQRKSLVKTGGTPGKTREINYFRINDSHYFVDLPGYGYAAASEAERAQILGRVRIFLTTEAVELAMVVLVIDSTVGLTDIDKEMLRVLRGHGRTTLLVANKIDKCNQKQRSSLAAALAHEAPHVTVFFCSTTKKSGIDDLRDYVLA